MGGLGCNGGFGRCVVGDTAGSTLSRDVGAGERVVRRVTYGELRGVDGFVGL